MKRGLVRPQVRRGGRRMYGSEELRRLAFIKLAHRLGLPLQTAAAVLDAAVEQLAFGPQTWPHALARAMLAEQVYRAATILAGAPYHRD